jgi:hypothetical protein
MQPGIYRSELSFEQGYVQAPTGWLRDPNISFKAKGLLVYLLSHKVGYTITRAQIVRESTDGRDAVDAAIRELVKAGYLQTSQTRQDDGRNGALAFTICEPESENPSLVNPESEKPFTEKPFTDNPTAKEDIKLENIKLSIKQNSKGFKNDWSLPADQRTKLEAQYPNANLDAELALMIDYLIANGKEKSVKDMAARFRTWMANADKFNKGAYSTRVMDEWFVKPENRVQF